MKSFKSTLIFAFVVVAISIVAYWDLNRGEKEEEKKIEESKALPYWSSDQINELRIVNDNRNELHLVKKLKMANIIPSKG